MIVRRTRAALPLRVRHEPPTIEEAVAAAAALSTDPRQQAEIAAGLMGVIVREVEAYRVKASQGRRLVVPTSRARRPVLVERKLRRMGRAE